MHESEEDLIDQVNNYLIEGKLLVGSKEERNLDQELWDHEV